MNNLNQGKRKEQIEFSEKMAGGSMIIMIILSLIKNLPIIIKIK